MLAALIALGIAADTTVHTATVTLAGKPQQVHLYPAERPARVVVLSSGDLGWAGFVVDVAAFLQQRGVAVLGFDTRRYLEGVTSKVATLETSRVPADYSVLVREAAQRFGGSPPVLVGVSEGAGLSVIAAASGAGAVDAVDVRGVIGLGLPESVVLGWRPWRDWLTWITKQDPDEPTAAVIPYLARLPPRPLVMIHATHDEFVPLETARRLFAAARDPKRLYVIAASNHRFGDNRDELHARLIDALEWIDTVR